MEGYSTGTTVTTTMQFYYNALGTPVAFKYNNTLYYYMTNLQGDVAGAVGSQVSWAGIVMF